MEATMTSPTLVPVIGSVSDGQISKGTSSLVTIVTTTGFVITISNQDLEAAQVVQTAADPSQTLYRLFVAPDALVSVRLKASDWARIDTHNDALRASLLSSGAPKTTEDTA
jgi:hypothetical protein